MTVGKEKVPTDAKRKPNGIKEWQSMWLIWMSISPNLQFHIQEIDDLDEAWAKS